MAVTGSFTAVSQATAANRVSVPGKAMELSIRGPFVGTVQLQRTYDGTWDVVDSFTAPTEGQFMCSDTAYSYRLVCSAYTSGTIVVRLGA